MLRDISKIIYWRNILATIMLLCFVKFCFLDNFGFVTPLNHLNFYLFLVAILAIFTGSFFCMAYFTAEHVLKTITKKQLLIFYAILTSIGISIGSYISFATERPLNSLIFISISLLMFLYAKETNKKTLINNFVLAFLKPTCLIILWWMDSPLTLNTREWKIFLNLEIIFIYVIAVSFVANFVNSIFVDMVNIKKDLYHKHRTLPIVLGEKATKKTVFQITVAIVIASNCMIFYLISDTFIPTSLFLFLIIPQIYGCYKIKSAKNKKNYIFIIKAINISLFIGAFIFPVIAYFIKNAY